MDKEEYNSKILARHFNFIPAGVSYTAKEIKYKNGFCALTKTKFSFSRSTFKNQMNYSGLILKLFERRKEQWFIVWEHLCSIKTSTKPFSRADLLERKQQEENKGVRPAIGTKGEIRTIRGGLPGLGKKS